MTDDDRTLLSVEAVSKSFTNHLRGAVHRPVVTNVTFTLDAGEVAVLDGPSGVGKSSILRMIYGNYAIDAGRIRVRGTPAAPYTDLAAATPREVIGVRRDVIGYVSQFLRAIPRVSALDIVAASLKTDISSDVEAREKAADLLARLNLPRALFDLPPATFSGGEKQRVNIARGFIMDHPVLLLDEPTASLDKANRDVVCDMIEEKRSNGTAVLGIFHDADVRNILKPRYIDVARFAGQRAAA